MKIFEKIYFSFYVDFNKINFFGHKIKDYYKKFHLAFFIL